MYQHLVSLFAFAATCVINFNTKIRQNNAIYCLKRYFSLFVDILFLPAMANLKPLIGSWPATSYTSQSPCRCHHRDRRPEANVSSSIKSLPVLIVISVGTAILVAAIFLLAILGLAKDISNKPEQLAGPILAAAGGLVCLIGICFAVYLNNKNGRKAKERPQNAANSCFIFVHALCRRMQNRYGINTLGLYCLLSAYIETNFNTSSNMCWNKCYDGRTDLFIFTWNMVKCIG